MHVKVVCLQSPVAAHCSAFNIISCLFLFGLLCVSSFRLQPLPASLCRRGSLDVWSRFNMPLFPLMVLKFNFEPRSLLFSFSWVLVTECRRQEEEERMKRLHSSTCLLGR